MAYLDFNNFIQGAKAAADMNRQDANSARVRESSQLADARAEGAYGLTMAEAIPKMQSRVEDFTGTQAALAQLGRIREAVANLKNPDGTRVNEQQAAEYVRDQIQALNKTPGMQSDIARTSYLQGLDGTAAALAQRFAAGSGVAQATAQDLGVGRDYVQVVRNLQELNDPDKIPQNMARFGFTQIGKPEEGVWQDANGRIVSAFDFLRAKAATAANDMANTMPIADADRANQLLRMQQIYDSTIFRDNNVQPGVGTQASYTRRGNVNYNTPIPETPVAIDPVTGAAVAIPGVAPAGGAPAAKPPAVVPGREQSTALNMTVAPWTANEIGYNPNSSNPLDVLNTALSQGSSTGSIATAQQSDFKTTYAARANAVREQLEQIKSATGIGGALDRGLNFASNGYLRDSALANNPAALEQLKARIPTMAAEAQGLWAKHAQVLEFVQQVEEAAKRRAIAKTYNFAQEAPLAPPLGLELDQRWLNQMRAIGAVTPSTAGVPGAAGAW